MKRYNTPHRRRVIKTRLTEEEYAEFSERVTLCKMSQAEFIRQALTKSRIQPAITVSPVNDEFKEALGHTYDEPKRWQLHNINEIMNTAVTGWKPFSNPRMFAGYGRQKGWERDVSGNELPGNEDGFVELSEEECRQLELPKEWIA